MKANHKTYVKSLSVDELLDKEMELENIACADGGLDEDILMDIYELQFAITEELASRGVVDARDYDEYDDWQGCEEPEDYPPFDPLEVEEVCVLENYGSSTRDYPTLADFIRDGKEFMRWLSQYCYNGLTINLVRKTTGASFFDCEYDGCFGLVVTPSTGTYCEIVDGKCHIVEPTYFDKVAFPTFEDFAAYLKTQV